MAAFTAARAAAGGGNEDAPADANGGADAGPRSRSNATVWVASDREVEGVAGCSDGPSLQTLHRLRSLAAAAIGKLEEAPLASAAPAVEAAAAEAATGPSSPPSVKPDAATAATDAEMCAAMGTVFEPSMVEFDALLELAASKVPTAHLACGHSSAPPKPPKFANLHHGDIGKGLGVDPVGTLVGRLRERYGELALFFYDGYGGKVITLKWKPSAFLPGALRAAASQHRLLLQPTGGADASSWALPNAADMLAEMVEISAGLVKRVTLPKSSHAVRRAMLQA